jgi:hypothetical protein
VSDPTDRALRRQFAALRDHDAAEVPAFSRVLGRPHRDARGSFPLIGAIATIAVVVAIGSMHRTTVPLAQVDVATWRAASDALMDLAPPAPPIRPDFGTAALEQLVPRSLTIIGKTQ